MYTSVPTNQPGAMCDCEKASASDVHIPACAHGGYIDFFFFFFFFQHTCSRVPAWDP